MRTIVVPVDSIKREMNTLEYALSFAEAFKANLYIIQIQPKVGKEDVLKKESKKFLYNFINVANEKGVMINVRPVDSLAITHIENFNSKIPVDLIISSARTISTDEKLFLGGTTGSILKHTEIPMLIIPSNYKFKVPKTVMMAIRSGIIKKDGVMNPLQSILETFDGKMTLVQIKTPKFKEEDLNFHPDLAALTSKFFTSENATIFQGLLEHLNENKPDIICAIRRKRGFFKKLWEGNTIERKDFETRVPLLVLKGAF